MLWAMQAKYPDLVNLSTITKDEIIAQDLPCRSVKRAVEAGLLPKIPGYEYLVREI
jgi:hypothetical protein